MKKNYIFFNIFTFVFTVVFSQNVRNKKKRVGDQRPLPESCKKRSAVVCKVEGLDAYSISCKIYVDNKT